MRHFFLSYASSVSFPFFFVFLSLLFSISFCPLQLFHWNGKSGEYSEGVWGVVERGRQKLKRVAKSPTKSDPSSAAVTRRARVTPPYPVSASIQSGRSGSCQTLSASQCQTKDLCGRGWRGDCMATQYVKIVHSSVPLLLSNVALIGFE